MEKHARLAVVLLAFWTAFVVYRTAGYHELFGLELDRWSDDAFLVNLLALPAAVAALVFGVRWGMEGGVALRDMNWKRGLKRLWLLTAIPWMIYAFGEYDAAREISNAWRYYTYDGTSVSNNKADLPTVDSLDAAMDAYEKERQQADAALDPDGEREPLVNQLPDARRLNPEQAAEGIKVGREMGVEDIIAADKLPQLQEERDQAYWDNLVKTNPKAAGLVAKSPSGVAPAQDDVEASKFAKLAQDIHEPNFDWVIPVLLFPTVGVAFVALALWLAFLAVRWTWRGFHS